MGADAANDTSSAFAELPQQVGRGGGVVAMELNGRGIARLTARRGKATEWVELFRAHFGLEPPNACRRVSLPDVAIAAVSPDSWLATRESAGNAFANSLRSLLGDRASVFDLSDAYLILRLAGPRVRETLAKLVAVDVHARSFQPGDVAQTVCGYMNVTLWRLEDTAQDGPAFEIWVGRSFARSLHQAISHAAAEFGFVLEPGRAGG